MAARVPQQALRVADLAASIRFYEEMLRFDVHTSGQVAVLSGPGGASFLLAAPEADLSPWPEVGESPPGALIYLHRSDLPSLASELTARGIAIAAGPLEPHAGLRHLQVADPDGYLITFWETLPMTDAEVLTIYRETPARLRRAVGGLSEHGLDQPRAPGKWTLRQIVHHVVDADLSTFEVIRYALALPGRQIQTTPWNPDHWMVGLQCDRRPVGPALALMEAAHAWVLETVNSLPDALQRTVSWPSGYEASVRVLLRQVGGHALHHTVQIERARQQ